MSAKFLRAFIAFLKKLPHGMASNLGALFGRILWAVSFKRVNRLERRCVSALGVGITTARGIIRGSYINMGRTFAEFFGLSSRRDISRWTKFEGEQHLVEALSLGKGVILMTAHLANWELAGAAIREKGYPFNAIYTPQRNTAGIDDAVKFQREQVGGVKLVPSEGGGIKETFKVLKRGEILAIFQDLDARDDGIKIPFLGLPASVHVGISKLHAHFGCPVVPGRVVREKNGMLTLNFYPMLQLDSDMEKTLAMCNNVIESWIREHPEQWMWILDRWRSTLGECG